MKKTAILVLSLLFIGSSALAAAPKGPFGYSLEDDINRKPEQKSAPAAAPAKKSNEQSNKSSNNSVKELEFYGENTQADWEKEAMYYPNASVSSAVSKYKKGNFAGCLQEMISLTKIDPYNPVVYYYMGMAYTQVGNKDQAVKAYEQVIKLNPDKMLIKYSIKGRDCLVGGPTCSESSEASDAELDKFIKSPYGNGFSEDVDQQLKEQQLKNIQKTINKKIDLEDKDIEKIQKFDGKSGIEDGTKIASADVSNEDVLSAIETLKRAGVTVSVNPYREAMPQNSQYQELSMMLGSGNNNNNNSMMNMLPYLMNQNQNGQNINPQVIEAMMMNSMLPDFTFSDNNKKY